MIEQANTQLIKLLTILLRQNIPFAAFRLPDGGEIITLIQHHSLPESIDLKNFTFTTPGFVIAPFDASDQYKSYFLTPDCVFFSDDIDDIYIQKLSENNRYLSLEKQKSEKIQTTTTKEYIQNVNDAVRAMRENQFRKVVLSKVRKESFPIDFQLEKFFLKLCDRYPHAMVYLLQMPDVGCWAGATPEPLITANMDVARTVSLAGTQPYTGDDIESYTWTSKELEEQAIVTGFVGNTLKELGVEYTQMGQTNEQAANLIHLKTAFEFPAPYLNKNLGAFLKAMHPTPSVGGLPKTEAKSFIMNHENHQRTYYSGFLGPVNINLRTDIFVNLRCLQVFETEFVLYSGAGITTASVAENEWDETDNKMLTMLNVIRS
jgi:isochorismate synthase